MNAILEKKYFFEKMVTGNYSGYRFSAYVN